MGINTLNKADVIVKGKTIYSGAIEQISISISAGARGGTHSIVTLVGYAYVRAVSTTMFEYQTELDSIVKLDVKGNITQSLNTNYNTIIVGDCYGAIADKIYSKDNATLKKRIKSGEYMGKAIDTTMKLELNSNKDIRKFCLDTAMRYSSIGDRLISNRYPSDVIMIIGDFGMLGINGEESSLITTIIHGNVNKAKVWNSTNVEKMLYITG